VDFANVAKLFSSFKSIDSDAAAHDPSRRLNSTGSCQLQCDTGRRFFQRISDYRSGRRDAKALGNQRGVTPKGLL
jgi:hypothetical protein